MAANTHMPLAHLQMMQQAQQHMQQAGQQRHLQIPKVNFYPSQHPNPIKARRQDIKQAYRLLKPTKRSIWSPRRWWFGGKYIYAGDATHCCVDGCDIDELLRAVGNVYDMIEADGSGGRSLWDVYFKNSVTGEAEAFIAREGVTSGRRVRGTYCPEHLHLYHLLMQWERAEEMDEEASSGVLKSKLKKGVSTVAVPFSVVAKKDDTPPLLTRYEQFFKMLKEDNIPVMHMKNRATGTNDLTMVIFDMRQFQNGTNIRVLQGITDIINSESPLPQQQISLQALLNQTAPATTPEGLPIIPEGENQ